MNQVETQAELINIAADLFLTQGYVSNYRTNLPRVAHNVVGAGIRQRRWYTWDQIDASDIEKARHAAGRIFDFIDTISHGMKSREFVGSSLHYLVAELPEQCNMIRLRKRNYRQLIEARFAESLVEIEALGALKSDRTITDIAAQILAILVGAEALAQSYRARWPFDTARARIEQLIFSATEASAELQEVTMH